MRVFLPLLLVASAACAMMPARAADADAMRLLAEERGCTTCHQERAVPKGSKTIIASAPSWREIAARYRGRADAEAQLAREVVGGTDPRDRHWKNQAAFTSMLPNEVAVSDDEARSLVRWILSLR
ncbi:MAG TPA: c-type cytochrome [Usitatibacter sp.]